MQPTDILWEKNFGLVILPLNFMASEIGNLIAIIIFFALNIVFFVYSLKNWYNTQRPLLFLFMLGGWIGIPVEAAVDVLGSVWYPIANIKTACVFFGRPMPWWVVMAWAYMFGIQGAIVYLCITRGITRRQVWKVFAIACIIDFVLEEMWLLRTHGLLYYGKQPLWFDLFPLFWPPVNSLAIFSCGALAAIIIPFLRGWRLLLIPFLVPISVFGSYAFTGLPAFIVINAKSIPWVVLQLGGILSIILALLVTYGLSLIVASDSPYDFRKLLKSVHAEVKV